QVANALLPGTIPISNLNRPSKPAALAMLARVYLSMSDYANAEMYAKSCLINYSSLMDYNQIVVTSKPFPFRSNQVNPEILYQSNMLVSTSVMKSIVNPSLLVDSTLYSYYATDDLRDSFFFTSTPSLKAGYSNQIFPFSGLATDEVYLIKAECEARNGDPAAKNTLHTLLVNRYKTGTLPADTATNVLNEVLLERRKELISRGLRWTDLKRLNDEGDEIVLMRTIGGMSYTLEPKSPLYVLPIPPDVIMLSGMPQNPR
ncbi:MAG: RagB/SusD family nutrient uptake outer membrane protein, partial [Bacteroidota bacterium]|nr:RagB/SusD family nutrient uptake outer membrane protein [Bacteroidota bacterium]